MENRICLCRHSVASKVSFFFLCAALAVAIIMLVFVIILLSLGILIGKSTVVQLLIKIAAVFMAASLLIVLVRFFILCVKMETRKYRLDSSGIWISAKEPQFMSWEQVRDIAIIKFAKSASGDSYQTVICIWVTASFQDDIHKLETSYYYGLKNCNRFVLIDYDSTIFKALESYYPGNIYDYCD